MYHQSYSAQCRDVINVVFLARFGNTDLRQSNWQSEGISRNAFFLRSSKVHFIVNLRDVRMCWLSLPVDIRLEEIISGLRNRVQWMK
jgi:hypothetical protein